MAAVNYILIRAADRGVEVLAMLAVLAVLVLLPKVLEVLAGHHHQQRVRRVLFKLQPLSLSLTTHFCPRSWPPVLANAPADLSFRPDLHIAA
jgi:hypothetical protein